jgi:PhoPQ-activated pathogenicity-related protein
VRCEAVTAVLWQVPRQPLMGGKYEDELLSYTLHQFQETKDYTWPLLFPMVKSVVKAMDAVQEFTQKCCEKKVDKFVVNGFSKRGWTTWMTAATGDKRVVSIAPMVIDILNMPISVPYQRHMYGSYSIHIQDYVNLGLTEELSNPAGLELIDMIDPYSYRDKYTLPKMVFLGTNDEFWTVDAVKNYIDGIPGETYTSYVTNAGHGLGHDAFISLEAFFHQTIHGTKYPRMDYKVKKQDGKAELNFNADKELLEDVLVWEAYSDDKDFRPKKFEPSRLGISAKANFSVEVAYPEKGYKAFMVMLKYKHPSISGATYNITTRMYTADSDELFDEAFVP